MVHEYSSALAAVTQSHELRGAALWQVCSWKATNNTAQWPSKHQQNNHQTSMIMC